MTSLPSWFLVNPGSSRIPSREEPLFFSGLSDDDPTAATGRRRRLELGGQRVRRGACRDAPGAGRRAVELLGPGPRSGGRLPHVGRPLGARPRARLIPGDSGPAACSPLGQRADGRSGASAAPPLLCSDPRRGRPVQRVWPRSSDGVRNPREWSYEQDTPHRVEVKRPVTECEPEQPPRDAALNRRPSNEPPWSSPPLRGGSSFEGRRRQLARRRKSVRYRAIRPASRLGSFSSRSIRLGLR